MSNGSSDDNEEAVVVAVLAVLIQVLCLLRLLRLPYSSLFLPPRRRQLLALQSEMMQRYSQLLVMIVMPSSLPTSSVAFAVPRSAERSGEAAEVISGRIFDSLPATQSLQARNPTCTAGF